MASTSKMKCVFGTTFVCVTFVMIFMSNERTRSFLSANVAVNKTVFTITGKSVSEWTNKLKTTGSEHVIVLYNPDFFSPFTYYNETLAHGCVYTNCRLTTDRSNLRDQSAIMFFLMIAPPLPKMPPLLPSERRPDQAWIFSWLESPVHHGGSRAVYKNKYWHGTANWTMTYLHDADVVLPYGYVSKRTHPVLRNYSEIFRRKTKMAAWVVSNCHTQSKREVYVEKLRKFGVDVDIYGRCAGKRVDAETIRRDIDRDYKFYLSFENSLCKDYITEKFFSYFQLDVIPVVRGGGNYSSHVTERAFINTDSFPAIKHLAQYLLAVASSEKLYTEYLRNKDYYVSNDREYKEMRGQSYCEMCRKLNNLESNRRTHIDLVHTIHNGTCYTPNDLN